MTRTTAGLLVVFLWTLLGTVPAGAQVHPGPFDPGCAASTGFAIDLISASKYRGPIYNENACRDARGRRLGYIPLVLLKQRELRIQASSTRAAAEPLLLDGKGRLIAQARRDTVLVYRAAPGIYYAGARMLGPGVGTGTLQLAIQAGGPAEPLRHLRLRGCASPDPHNTSGPGHSSNWVRKAGSFKMDISLGEYGCREAKGRSLWHIRYLMPPGGATVTFRVTPRGEHPVSLYVLSATGEAVAKAAGTQSAEIHRTLPGGIYYVGIAAAREPGKPDPVFDIEARLDLPAVGDGVGSHARDGSAGTADVTLSAMRALRDGSCPIYTSHAIDVAASRNPVRANKLGVRCKRADGQNADYFTMPVAETQAVRFSLTSADFDPFLLLRDGRGRLLVQKQGSGTVLEQTLQPGMYFVAVSGSTPADSGKYRLEITTTRAKSFLEKACPSWMGLMIVKEGLSGFSLPERTACRLTTGERVVYYSFVAVAPTLLSVRAWSSKFGARAALLDKNGALLAAHSGQGRGAATVKRELMPGLYYVAISGQGPEAAGFYSLEVKLDNL